MEQEAYRHVPYDIEIEQALLGAILVDNRALETVSALIKPEHFYDPLHQRLYETMSASLERGGMVLTPLTLHAAMKADPGLQEVGGHAYLAGLAQAAPAMPNVQDYARILRDLAVRRSLIRIGEDIVNTAFEAPHEKSTQSQIEEAEKALYRVSETSRYGEGPLDFAESLRRAVESAEKAQARGGKISGVPSGFTDIDGLLGGLQPSDLLILAGRPGMGKTALGTNMAFHAARAWQQDIEIGQGDPHGAPVLFFSLEMAAQQLSARILSEQTEIEMWKIRNGRFSESEWEKFVLTMQDLSTLPLFIDDTGGISIAQIAARARRLKREKKIGLIIIDYLQLVEPSRRQDNRVQEITEVTKGLKALAKELNVPVLALSQLSRGVDARDDKRPVLSDLRESGSIEQDADVVMFVYREEYYLKSREPEIGSSEHGKWLEKCERAHRRAEVLVEKHRHGATNKVELFFDDRFTRFSNLANEASR
ncbi:MAG: replicative DNA helicase [Alphaproteobacteria bacterium]|nr:replicative DNA helicase [Alphaproteobacteria bacterium]MDE2495197.1 replicative DNA helicase [Alphaproteobacteria bacterium]